jgi:hypothetical protein
MMASGIQTAADNVARGVSRTGSCVRSGNPRHASPTDRSSDDTCAQTPDRSSCRGGVFEAHRAAIDEVQPRSNSTNSSAQARCRVGVEPTTQRLRGNSGPEQRTGLRGVFAQLPPKIGNLSRFFRSMRIPTIKSVEYALTFCPKLRKLTQTVSA